MFALARLKRDLGARLASQPFMAEASMTFLDGCLATGILLALALNLVFACWWADPVAALLIGAIAGHQAHEGWEAERVRRERNHAARRVPPRAS